MNTIPPPARPGNPGAPPPTNARVPGDIRKPILDSLDAMTAAWNRRQAAEVDAAHGKPDPDGLAAARADYEAAQARFLAARGDMAELFLGLVRNAQADPAHADLAAREVAKLGGVPDLERIIVHLNRRLEAAEARAAADRGRLAEVEELAARLAWEAAERHDQAGSAVPA